MAWARSFSLTGQLGAAVRSAMGDPDGRIDFAAPAGEPALASPDSVSWRVFKNPIALYVGGITAVLLELAEPRVRTGVWEHSSFRTDPIARMRRTGLAAMITVYGARSVAERLIAGVSRMHGHVQGTTPCGQPYRADDPRLLDWVQATASFGFLEAYHNFARALSDADKDRFYAEARPAARLYGAIGAPASRGAVEAHFSAMQPRLEASPIVLEFLEIICRAPILPAPVRPFQRMLARAAVAIAPDWLRVRLGLDSRWKLRSVEARIVRLAGIASDRLAIPGSPPVQACRRMGLPANYLYISRPPI